MKYSEVKNLPVRYRQWFVKRLVKHFQKINDHNSDDEPINMDNFNKFDDMVKKKMS